MHITAVTCVKNEGPFLLEWIAYNRLIGVNDFLFYSNDCTDGTDLLLDALAARGILHHLPNPAQGRAYQMEALKHSAHQACTRDADWVWVADVDEFLNIHVGDHSLAALIEACGSPQAISVHFQFFANGGIDRYEDRPILEQFTHSHNPDIWCGETAIEVKSLIRHDFPLAYYGAHRPFLRKSVGPEAALHWTDGSGRNVPDAFIHAETTGRQRKFPAKGARRFATLNHYALRSLDSYLVKNDRGDVNRENRAFDDSYWRERNDAVYEDRSIQRMLPALTAALAELKSDPEIAALHADCVAHHRACCDALKAQPAYQQMRATLKTAPPLSPKEEALMNRLNGLDVAIAPTEEQTRMANENNALRLQASARRASAATEPAARSTATPPAVPQVQTDMTPQPSFAPRATQLKVVNLGLPKSGTTTFNQALSEAGWAVADHRLKSREDPNDPNDRVFLGQMMYEGLYRHGDPAAFLSGFDALSEISFLHGGQSIWPQFDLAMLRKLRQLYPELRFVATRRDTDKHVSSIMRWNNLGTQRIPMSTIPGLPMGYGGTEAEQKIWIDGHYDTLSHWFRDDPLYLELDVAAPDAQATLEHFLGIPLPWWGTANANPDQDSDGATAVQPDGTGEI